MKTTGRRYTGELQAKVALQAIRVDLTLVQQAGKQARYSHDDDLGLKAAGD